MACPGVPGMAGQAGWAGTLPARPPVQPLTVRISVAARAFILILTPPNVSSQSGQTRRLTRSPSGALDAGGSRHGLCVVLLDGGCGRRAAASSLPLQLRHIRRLGIRDLPCVRRRFIRLAPPAAVGAAGYVLSPPVAVIPRFLYTGVVRHDPLAHDDRGPREPDAAWRAQCSRSAPTGVRGCSQAEASSMPEWRPQVPRVLGRTRPSGGARPPAPSGSVAGAGLLFGGGAQLAAAPQSRAISSMAWHAGQPSRCS